MSGAWTSSEAFPFSGAAATGGRRRRHTKKAEGGRRRRAHKGGDEVMPAAPPAAVTEDAAAIAGAKMPKTMEAGRRRHTKAKKVAKALLKLSKKLKAGKRSRKH